MTTRYDVVVIGAGHNGLVTAAYLAKAGRKVLVVERRAVIGGAAVTEELFPGFKFSACADGAGRLSPQVVRDLDLRSHGLQILPADPMLFAPQPNGDRLLLWRDVERTANEIARFSKRDAARYPDYVKRIGKIAGWVTRLMAMTPPDVAQPGRADGLEVLKVAWPARRLGRTDLNHAIRILPMAVADMLGEWFESDVLKGALAAGGVTGLSLGPKQAGTTYLLLTTLAGDHLPPAGLVKGGMGALSESIADAARHFGAEVRVGAEVAQVLVDADRVTGIRLAGGETIEAGGVVANADPRTMFLRLLDPQHVDPVFLQQVQRIRYRGSMARVHLALNALPKFAALNGDDPAAVLRGHIRIAPGVDYLERAADDAKYGAYSRRPYLDVTIPSLADPDLAPPGQHVLSISVQYAPYHLKTGDWEAQREAFGDVVIDTLAEYAPDLREKILHRRVFTPCDLETIYGLPEGSPSHGEMTLDQFLYMRPVPGCAQYRTPIRNLYLCGASTHPGGGVTGLNGRNAARAVLRS